MDYRGSYLTRGDSYNPATHTATYPSWKTQITTPQYQYAITTNDIFSSAANNGSSPDNTPDDIGDRENPREFAIVSTRLFNSQMNMSTWGETYEQNPTFKVMESDMAGLLVPI